MRVLLLLGVGVILGSEFGDLGVWGFVGFVGIWGFTGFVVLGYMRLAADPMWLSALRLCHCPLPPAAGTAPLSPCPPTVQARPEAWGGGALDPKPCPPPPSPAPPLLFRLGLEPGVVARARGLLGTNVSIADETIQVGACACTCACVCMCVPVPVPVCTCACVCVSVCALCACMHACLCVCTHASVCACACAHACMRVHVYLCNVYMLMLFQSWVRVHVVYMCVLFVCMCAVCAYVCCVLCAYA